MILGDFLVQTKTGLFCSYGNFYLDPRLPVKDAVISHAHGDHAINGNVHVYCTRATSLFMLHRYKIGAAGNFHIYDYENSFNINGVQISFIPAGHILGSAQVLMEYKGIRYLYTGDYKLQQDNTCAAMKFVTADVLITETTFANPDVRHPAAEEEILKLNNTGINVMLGAYALGKSQRLINLISSHCIEKRILVHHSIMPFVKIYERLDILVGNYEPYDRRVMKNNQQNVVYIVPPMVFGSFIKPLNMLRAFATGWTGLQKANDIQLYISDHADWNDIVNTINQVEPSQVWTTHGDGEQLKLHYQNSLVVKLLN
jgi:putative mRNA 3-end processing factor